MCAINQYQTREFFRLLDFVPLHGNVVLHLSESVKTQFNVRRNHDQRVKDYVCRSRLMVIRKRVCQHGGTSARPWIRKSMLATSKRVFILQPQRQKMSLSARFEPIKQAQGRFTARNKIREAGCKREEQRRQNIQESILAAELRRRADVAPADLISRLSQEQCAQDRDLGLDIWRW